MEVKPACVEEMGAPSGPKGAGRAGSPMVAAGRMSSRMGGLVQTHLDRSRGLLLWVDLRSSSLAPSGHSTSPHGCSRAGKEVEAGLGQKVAGKGTKVRNVMIIAWDQGQDWTHLRGLSLLKNGWSRGQGWALLYGMVFCKCKKWGSNHHWRQR